MLIDSTARRTSEPRRRGVREYPESADEATGAIAALLLSGDIPCAVCPGKAARRLLVRPREARPVPRFGTCDDERGKSGLLRLGSGRSSSFGKASASLSWPAKNYVNNQWIRFQLPRAGTRFLTLRASRHAVRLMPC